MFLGLGNRWRKWKPTDDYLLAVQGVDTSAKLQTLMKKFVYKWDTIKFLFWTILWDNWQMPDESLKLMHGDCDDSGILAADILGRIQKRDNARFIMSFGYYTKDGKRKCNGHCVTAFDNGTGKYDVFSNSEMWHNFDDFIAIGHKSFPLGLKYQEIRDWQGNVLSRKFKIFGTF